MPSTFSGIEIGKRSLLAHSQGLNTIGHNLSNASVEGYSRQRVEMRASPPIYLPQLNREERAGQIGQGVEVERIERIRDMLLEARIVAESNAEGYWESRDKYLLMLEQVYNEPMELSLRGSMDKFWESWQELSVHPQEMGARQAVLQRGMALMDSFHQRFMRFKGIRDMLEGDIQATVRQVNNLTAEIAALNEQIVKSKAMDDNPNDLLDRRDLLVGELSALIDITVGTRDPDEFIIYSGGEHIVQGRHFEKLVTEADRDNEGYSRIHWQGESRSVFFRGGKLAALVELRDVDTRGEIQKLDLVTVNFIDLVNEIHRKGYSLSGRSGLDFFVEYPFINNISGNYDRNGDGEYDSSYIFRISGNNQLKLKEQIGLRGTLTLPGAIDNIAVEYYPTDTVEDLISRINLSGAEVAARLNQNGQLSIKGLPAGDPAYPDFVLRYLEDSGQFLAGYAGILRNSGTDGAFDWQQADAVIALRGGDLEFAVAPLAHPAGWIEVNPALLKDPGAIAAASNSGRGAGGHGDGSAALAIATLRTDKVMIGNASGFDEFFAASVTEIGLKGEEASRALETEKLVIKNLKDMRESISGVNIDEELTNMIKFQHGYSAGARFITEIDRMLDIIINRMGV